MAPSAGLISQVRFSLSCLSYTQLMIQKRFGLSVLPDLCLGWKMLTKPRLAQNGLPLAFLTLISGISASPVSSLKTLGLTGPTPVSVTPSFVSDVVENTHTSTIGQDGHATPIPIVGGPKCWVSVFKITSQKSLLIDILLVLS